jgi:hypothetical protein
MFRLRECHCASALARLRPWNCRNAHDRLRTIRLRAVRACHTGWQRWRRAVSFHVRQSAMTKCPPAAARYRTRGRPALSMKSKRPPSPRHRPAQDNAQASRVPPPTGHPASTNQRSCIASESGLRRIRQSGSYQDPLARSFSSNDLQSAISLSIMSGAICPS